MKPFRVGLVVAMVVSLNACSATIGKTIRDYGGYSELRPPTTLVPPGTVVELTQQAPAILDIVCSQAASLGDQFRVPESSTYDQSLVQAVNATFNIDSEYLTQLKLDAKYASVKSIKLTISNATIAQLSADTVYASVVYRKPECQQAIDDYIADKRIISMITSVLKADVAYSVDFDDSVQLNLDNKKEILSGLAEKLGAKYESIGSNLIHGDGLYWGIKDNSKLAFLRKNRSISIVNESESHNAKIFEGIGNAILRLFDQEDFEQEVFDPSQVMPVITPASYVVKVQSQPRVK